MLQQTTVAAVVPFFERFVAAFPTVRALADADEQAVLKLWQGLGYYRRARHLHAAAKRVVEEFDGIIPDDPAAFESLPGIGRYIAGAVLSQAFELRLPIVEANSLRVLSRLFGSSLDPREGEGKKWVWEAAEAVLPAKRVGDFNQAVMELGALVCTPDAPKCDTCPLRSECVANATGKQAEIPPKPKRMEAVAVREVCLVLRDGRKVLLARIPPDASRWANMWELPRGELLDGESVDAGAVRLAKELLGLTVSVGAEVASVTHGVTRFIITLTAVNVTRTGGRPKSTYYPVVEWVPPDRFADYPAATSQRKLFAALADPQKRLF
jgi:A/G-specific adenine glycosylase